MQPRVRRRDDGTDGLLVKALVTFATLEVLEVAANRALLQEPRVLRCVDPAQSQGPIRSLPSHRPALARRERLAKKRKIGEGRHRLDTGLRLEAVTHGFEVELGFEMVHPGFE